MINHESCDLFSVCVFFLEFINSADRKIKTL